MGQGDESRTNGVDGDASDARHDHVIDWLEQASDLPHLIARVSELVLRLGYDPDELVTLPRAELDRRELAAYSAGWADVVAEQLPAIRRAYEERITAAYLQGQEDARTGRRPRRARRSEGERSEQGGEVIQLPYVQLLRPPSEVTRVEARGERERSVADGTPVPAPGQAPEANVVRENPGRREESSSADSPGGSAGGSAGGSSGEILLSAREVREKRSASAPASASPSSSGRRPVVRRNGRPSVPPLSRSGEAGAGRDKERRSDPVERIAQEQPERSAARAEKRRRLSDRARALADELEGRASVRRRDDEPGTPGGH
ncbi:hypothetical protein OG562_25860 [Streptomyces sp. NBC_01275]|uniref:hypothetical protein n=1 Tax=Streptomyces sp. NBC_01275 TaxID=2903807 RepID=UPI0022586986|nr:hypothetical protein [Streptomyces sp. NBC_01275]MCX4764324.1 hypothetical protein [Streptomyces sp. NBC_01275]